MTVSEAYEVLYTGMIIGLLVLCGIMLIRAIKGPGITDRILSVNMIGTMVVSIIAICSLLLHESYLVDVALIYTMISFIAVMMMGMMYISPERRGGKKKKSGKGNFRSQRSRGRSAESNHPAMVEADPDGREDGK